MRVLCERRMNGINWTGLLADQALALQNDQKNKGSGLKCCKRYAEFKERKSTLITRKRAEMREQINVYIFISLPYILIASGGRCLEIAYRLTRPASSRCAR